MDGLKTLDALKAKTQKNRRFLHSENHVLADELSKALNDTKHFGFYLKMAQIHNHSVMRKLCAEILENKNVQTPGKLFAFLLKKQNTKEK